MCGGRGGEGWHGLTAPPSPPPSPPLLPTWNPVTPPHAPSTQFGGELGATGSVSWQFPLSGHLLVDLKREADGSGGVSEDSVLAAALDAGATDVQVDDEEGTADVMCPPNLTHQLKVALAAANVPVVSASITRFPSVRARCWCGVWPNPVGVG